MKQRAIAARDKSVLRRAGRRADAAGPGPEDPTRRPAASADLVDSAVNDPESAPLNPPTDIRSAETPPENRTARDAGGAESWAGSDTQATG